MRFPLAAILVVVGAATRADEPKFVAAPEAFRTLVNPNCSHCIDEAKRRSAELKPLDPVLCWTRGYSDGGVIPIRFFLNPYRVISDSYGVFVYDPDAGYARGFAPNYRFTFHGWRNGVMVMKHEDGTLFSCLTGVAFEGPRKGERLAVVPTVMSTWGNWTARYPNAVAYHMFDKYQPMELPATDHPVPVRTRLPADPRVPANEPVLGVRLGNQVKAYPVQLLDTLRTERLGNEPFIILRDGPAVAAYRPIARQPRKFKAPRPNSEGVSPPDPGTPLPPGAGEIPPQTLTFRKCHLGVMDNETGSHWDVTGRAIEGELKGWTLEPLDSVVCRWFAWAAEYPATAVEPLPARPTANTRVKEIAGTAEFLRVLPKPFATIKAVNARAHTVSLLFEGDTIAKQWPLEPDAEIKVNGWWGRLEQFQPNQRVWVWLKLDRHRNPVSVLMLADEASEEDMHGSLAPARKAGLKFTAAQLDERRAQQKKWLQDRWLNAGLPGTLTFHHIFSGELELTLDHEARHWARALVAGDLVHVTSDPAIKGVVKSVRPERERTVVRLVVGELEASELKVGQRLALKVPAPSESVLASPYPSDIGRRTDRTERIEWFLASIYCNCGVSKDICTGHFYTLASCNPNGCGLPNNTRKEIGAMIDAGKTDQEIWDALLKSRGPLMIKPHLLP